VRDRIKNEGIERLEQAMSERQDEKEGLERKEQYKRERQDEKGKAGETRALQE